MQSIRVPALLALLLTTPSAFPAAASEHPQSQQEYWAEFDQRDWSAAIAAAQKLVAAA
jgi:hypothetical protein